MKKWVTLCSYFLSLASLLCYGSVFADIQGSSHDFTPVNGGTFMGNSNEVCIYCHTPHGGVGRDSSGNRVALWNRTLNESASFTMYSSPTFSYVLAVQGAPTRPVADSLLCLSCHDGVSSLETVINYSSGPIVMNYKTINALTYPPYANVNISRDLSDDHPVSFVYDADLVGRNHELRLPTPENLGALKLFNGRIECTTCHDPHDNDTYKPFLRMGNAGSAMCRQCHLK